MSNEKYRGKTVVITGASTGFGRDTALELARRGCRLVLAARGADTQEEVAHECRTSGRSKSSCSSSSIPRTRSSRADRGKIFNVFHRLLPRTVEAMMADRTEKAEFDSPPALASAGAVHEPSER